MAKVAIQEPRGIHRRIVFEVTESLKTRLLRGIEVKGPDECWPWLGAPRNGYGAIKHDGKVLGTHVVSYVLHKGPLKDGEIVTHDCDNRLCCNPKHLVAGTHTTNVREMYSRRNPRTCTGESAYNAVLTQEKVRAIHALWAAGYGRTDIARMVEGTEDSVKGVIYAGRWAHVAKPTVEEAAAIVQHFCPLSHIKGGLGQSASAELAGAHSVPGA